MQVPALVEPLADRPGFRASLGEPFNLSVEADTCEEAARQLTAALEAKLAGGARLVMIRLPGAPSLATAGWLPDDDLTRDWLQSVEEYRQECDLADRKRILGESEEEKVAS